MLFVEFSVWFWIEAAIFLIEAEGVRSDASFAVKH